MSTIPHPAMPLEPEVGAIALPKAPLLGWDSFWPPGRSTLPSVGDLPYRAYTSSGRAALHAALQQMALPAGAGVLVPTYHCPTMVAPIVEAGLTPLFYPIGDDGLPALGRITPRDSARAMFVTHYFGMAQSLHAVQAWCRQRGILLVEDCAHSYFGFAGERPVGHWGDYAIASVSKFFPVPEAGLLASASRPLQPLALQAPTLRAHARSLWNVIDRANDYHRLAGVTHVMRPLFWMRRRQDAHGTRSIEEDIAPDADAIRAGCDMSRIREAPSLAARLLHRNLPQGRIVQRRRENYVTLARELHGAPGARALTPDLASGSAPYVLPLWVDGLARSDAVYARIRDEQLPVFRWDRRWPGTPSLADDNGALWSHQILQVLCHQDLSQEQLVAVADRIRQALNATRAGGA